MQEEKCQVKWLTIPSSQEHQQDPQPRILLGKRLAATTLTEERPSAPKVQMVTPSLLAAPKNLIKFSSHQPLLYSTKVHVGATTATTSSGQMPSSKPSNTNKRSQRSSTEFFELKDKAEALAEIFHGKLISSKSFSICKGQFSLRFNCINEHNFYLSADQVRKADLVLIKHQFKQYRLKMQSIFESKPSDSSLISYPDPCCWCPKCVEYFEHSLQSHNSSVLTIIGGLFTKQIMYRCVDKPEHIFYISSVRKHAFQK